MSPAAPSSAQLDPLGVERDVDGTVLDLLVLRDGLHGGQVLARRSLRRTSRVEGASHFRHLERHRSGA